jgi:hypothetical protein
VPSSTVVTLKSQEYYLRRIIYAFQAFFAILFAGKLPAGVSRAYGPAQKAAKPVPQPKAAPQPKAVPQLKPSDGAIQMLSILQRDSRLIDFLMEDIAPYSDDQVGAAVRSIHDRCRETMERYITLAPVIDGVEGTFTKLDAKLDGGDPNTVKLLGNVPASGKAAGGILRHKGWRAERVDLPQLAVSQNSSVVAPAEIEVE